jgi:hypothetical protein
MSSLTSSNDRFRVFSAMALAGLVALCISNERASCQPIASAAGNQTFLAAPVTLTGGAETTNINVNSVNGGSGLYDVNGLVTLSNASATLAQTITTQYFIGASAVSPAVTTVLAGGAASTTVALPQQIALQPTSAAVSLHVTNSTGTANVTVGIGSGVTVTGYANNFPATASGPGSANLSAPVTPTTPPITNLTVAIPAVPSAQGLYSLNSSLFINNISTASQTIRAQYTVDGATSGSIFQVTLPGSGSTMLSLPTQLSGLGAGAHNISINVSGAAGLYTIGTGSSLSATSYNATGSTNSATATQIANAGLGVQQGTFGGAFVPNGGTPAFFVRAPASGSTVGFYDANAVLMLLNPAGTGTANTITAQYVIGGTNGVFTDGTPVGPVFTTVLSGAAGSVAELYMPDQIAANLLPAGTSLAVMLIDTGDPTKISIEADSLTLIAHNSVPNAATPEPASMSLAAMAMMAFGAAAYRKRKAGRVQA